MNTTNMQLKSLRNYGRMASVGFGLPLGLGAAALLLAGCGGTTTGGATIIRETIPSTPTAYGLSATAITNTQGGDIHEISGLESAAETATYLTAATASTAVPINTIQGATGSIPLGFAPSGLFANGVTGTAVAPGTSVKFRVSLSNGSDANGTTYQIDPNKVTLTSPDLVGQTFPLSFSPNTGTDFGLASATYVTGAFTLPAGLTTGLHNFTISVTDTKPQTSTTIYAVVVVRPTDAAVLVSLGDNTSATITNPIAGTTATVTPDEQGEAVLFAKPGAQTITGSDGKTLNVTLVAGQVTVVDGSGNGLAVP